MLYCMWRTWILIPSSTIATEFSLVSYGSEVIMDNFTWHFAPVDTKTLYKKLYQTHCSFSTSLQVSLKHFEISCEFLGPTLVLHDICSLRSIASQSCVHKVSPRVILALRGTQVIPIGAIAGKMFSYYMERKSPESKDVFVLRFEMIIP